MTKETIDFLQNLQHELLTQPNDGNADPVWWGVMETRSEGGYEDGYEDYYELYSEASCESLGRVNNIQDIINAVKEDDESFTDEHFKDCEDMDDVMNILDEMLPYGEKYRLVGCKDISHINEGCVFLTKKDCLDYIEKFGYNHHRPHSYAMTAYRCFTFERLINILKSTDWSGISHKDEWIDNRKPASNGKYLVTIHQYGNRNTTGINVNDIFEDVLEFKDSEWLLKDEYISRYPSSTKIEVIAWKPLQHYNGKNMWHRWQVVAYDKDYGYYKVFAKGSFDEMKSKLFELDTICRNDKLLNTDCHNEPFDWVFMEPEDSDGSETQYLAKDILDMEE